MYQPLIIQHLFQVSSLEDVSRERLEAFVESYPSYGIGHYLLSCKLQAEGSDRFLPETQRTCLYFSNPLWLQWLLQNTNGEVAVQPSPVPALETVPTPPAVESYPEEPAVEPFPPEHAVSLSPEPAVEAEAETPVANVVTMAEEAFAGTTTDDDLAETLTPPETLTSPEALTSADTTPDTRQPSAADLLLRSIEEARGLRDSLAKLHEEDPAGTTIAGESLPESGTPVTQEAVVPWETPAAQEVAALQEEAPVTQEASAMQETIAPQEVLAVEETIAPHEDPIRDEEAPFFLEESEEQPGSATAEAVAPVAETSSAEQPVPAEAQSEIATPAPVAEMPSVEQPAPVVTETPAEAEAPKKTATATQDFLFEPYHTIDYFASQGIKLTLDENPTDNLGKQLKSFTEWLKTMRRLPQKDREVVPDRVAEEAIQTIAAHSVQGKDVLTETMAEVLAKQGMREKARAVYEKLSLLNPDKSAYFAAKIEQLNIP